MSFQALGSFRGQLTRPRRRAGSRWLERRRTPTRSTRPRSVGRRRWLSSDAPPPSDAVSSELIAHRLKDLAQKPDAIEAWAQQLTTVQRNEISRLLAESSTRTAVLSVPEPTMRDLRLVAFTNSIPFLGFGIMDNAILIVAGDVIDHSLGVSLGISTMCAAAIGNIVSDVAGIGLGTVIEDFCAVYLKIPTPNLTSAQRQLRSVRYANQFGCAVGIVVGCIIGMFPLLYIDSNRIQAKKQEATLDALFQDVVSEAGSLVGAAETALYILVDSAESMTPTSQGKFLYAKYGADHLAENLDEGRLLPLGRGIVSRAALTGQSWNIADVRAEPDHVNSSPSTRSTVCVPIMDAQGRPIAVLQAINKKPKSRSEKEESTPTFTSVDVQLLVALASHISISLQRLYEMEGQEADLRLKHTIRLLKDYGLAGITDDRSLSDGLSSQKTSETPQIGTRLLVIVLLLHSL